MSDLKDFELAELRNGEPDADQCERAAKEIERHRAARAADAERVRSVVREVAKLSLDACYYDDRIQARVVYVNGRERPGCVENVATAIAARAAERLTESAPVASHLELDAERVRKIITGIAFDVMPGSTVVDDIDRLATRAAEQLAGVRSDQREMDVACYAEVKRERDSALSECERLKSQLAGAGVGLSVEERAMLRGLALDSRIAAAEAKRRGSDTWSDAHTSRAKLLDRLLASPPDPTTARLALVEAFVAGAAYVQDHWYVGEQLSIELETGADIERAADQHADRANHAPDLRSALCALLDSDMPAGDLRKALAELVGRR